MGISSPFSRLVNWPIVFGMACVMLCEGFDLIIYSSLIPPLIGDADMGVDKAAAGFIGSMTFLGMFFGGISAGAVKRRLGYVRTIAFGVIWFSLAVAAAAFAPSGAVLGALRALAGLGLGVVLPVAMSLARAYSTRRMSALVISIVMTGIPFGGLMAAFLCAALLSVFGWRPLMFVAGLIGLVLLAFIMPFVAKQVEQCLEDFETPGRIVSMVEGKRGN
ncbi:MFS transporter [Slackia exigua]|uniref:MFS transporter n=1 Tax=Slackia exigua TaxID=84109 RepID=UPI00254E6164|nr:MFS transporter [Slackia exigua]MDK7723933.1 MFS transporter [Slackia exigua]MDK7725164.1 MFS transporter [Slackia exigua]